MSLSKHAVANMQSRPSNMTCLGLMAALTAQGLLLAAPKAREPAGLQALSSKICAPESVHNRPSATRLGGWLPLRYNLFHARTLSISLSLTPYTSCISGKPTIPPQLTSTATNDSSAENSKSNYTFPSTFNLQDTTATMG